MFQALKVIVTGLAASASFGVVATDADNLVRVKKTLLVDGAEETWSLRWESAPETVCGAEQREESLTCPCDGFAYGERGHLSLIRVKADGDSERLNLGRPFDSEFPSSESEAGVAVLRRWDPKYAGD